MRPPTFALEETANRNKRAWDELYRQAEKTVWGESPIGFLEEFLSYLDPPLSYSSRVLDAGTGEGRNLGLLLAAGGVVAVCDSSLSALRKLRQRTGLSVQAAQCDLVTLPYRDDTFDFILMADVIETLPETKTALAEVHRVLKRHGQFLCNIPAEADPISSEGMESLGDGAYLYQGRYFYKFFESESAAAIITLSGLEIVRAECCLWSEAAHPNFRAYHHEHVSNVFLGRKR